MSAETLACAPAGVTWHGMDCAKVIRHTRGLQARIVKATQTENGGKLIIRRNRHL